MEIFLLVLLGFAAGSLSGLVGIGGGVVIIPALVYFFGFSQLKAQGTTIALMVPPIGILAALVYYKNGFVDLKVAALICAGFVVGGLLGANIVTGLTNELVRKIFGIFLLIISLKMIFVK
ncbi:MAG TPA: permease [Elusimicrobia bacterium]|nr:MAG: permease [Elusimicrobia bacterium RIFOXYA12_FULL_49_49]OGS09993.1 MAG: permease [Elusimicrobia bacterium RIFOXYA1_FULL_47_7]OGS11770.1 MAG: permease [Elusimicrobia bacterium RIFOXYB1_FULL_48_9]OGS15608.1 MAG: permease [Elusimicrobia bacterium RIFOXYA2_FULL_47_53]OGS26837.1 MAG: permease [Elusimicrobia bacterium RIFOXYB12_FULL_50_12]OGS30707.1 MAG: permease [Elusimicrobia bacterium RIFOXYB2_FULL_46_23]HBU68900.1 permease [Elusimicrobiota bacterium]